MQQEYVPDYVKVEYPLFAAPRPYSFDLNEDMLKMLREEFAADKVVTKFAEVAAGKKGEQLDAVAKQVFEQYGTDWMKRTIQLGEEYPDRTYEVIREAADHTGVLFFPLVPQRFVEIAYLSIQEFLNLRVVENSSRRLVYRVPKCTIFNALKEKLGDEVANALPCSYACLTAGRIAGQDFGLDVMTEQENAMPKDGFCQFALRKA